MMRTPIFQRAGLLATVVVLAFLPLPDFWITQLNYIALYSLVVLGLVLLTGIGGLTSFGQAAFVGIGAYATAWVCTSPAAASLLGGLASPLVGPWVGLALGLVAAFLWLVLPPRPDASADAASG